MNAAATRSRLAPATAYAHALTAARDLARAMDREDVPGALHAVTLWAEWVEASRREAQK
jgi:hypothetical protein